MRSPNLHTANAILEQVTENLNASVDTAIKPHVANSTMMGKAKRMSILDVTNIPLKLHNLPPGYTVQEIPPNVAYNANGTTATTNSTTSNTKSNMFTLMKLFPK